MNYFSHHVNRPIGKVWSLFSELAEASKEVSKTSSTVGFSHTLEIVNAALSGSICLDEESIQNFNLRAYEYKCNENDTKSRYISKNNKELFIVDNCSNDDEEKRVSLGDISMRRLGVKDKNLENLIESQAFDESLARLLGIREDIMVDYGVDLVRALCESIMGVTSAIKLVREVSEKNEQVEEIVTTLCSTAPNGGLYNRLKAVM